MELLDIRKSLRTKSIYDLHLRVVYYARVSTDSDNQANSLVNQQHHYDEMIKRNQNWEFCGKYIDDGVSGGSIDKREEFLDMIEDGLNGKYDLILTKEISRFARNYVDSISISRKLLSNGVGILFEEDGINTFYEDSELRLGIMAAIAQDELRKLSSRVKFGHQQAIKSHVVLGNSRLYGYRKSNKVLEIVEEEAQMVRKVFELYATDQYSFKQIEKILWDAGYRNHNGKVIAHTTLSNIIKNPKYKGYYVGNKVRIVDYITKKQKFLPESEWVMFKDESGKIVPQIVDEELWEKANKVFNRRSEDVKNRQGICNHPNLVTGKLYCANCGSLYYRKVSTDRLGNNNSTWVCSNKLKNGKDSCKSIAIYETELQEILRKVFIENTDQAEKCIEEYAKTLRNLKTSKSRKNEIDDIKKRIAASEKKQMKLLEFNIDGKISNEDYFRMNDECSKEIAQLNEEIAKYGEEKDEIKELEEKIKQIKTTLDKASKEAIAADMITPAFVNAYIDRILVTPINERHMQLDIILKTGVDVTKGIDKKKYNRVTSSSSCVPYVRFKKSRTNRRKVGHSITITYSARIDCQK